MSQLVQQLDRWIAWKEDKQCEFKEAKQRFDFEELVKYCVGLSNSGGGRIVLGVTDKRPRQVVGSQALTARAQRGVVSAIVSGCTWTSTRFHIPIGAFLVFHVPPRPVDPIQDKGIYWTRDGDSLASRSRRPTPTGFRRKRTRFLGSGLRRSNPGRPRYERN